jgi:hypothetical protein
MKLLWFNENKEKKIILFEQEKIVERKHDPSLIALAWWWELKPKGGKV